MRTPGSESIIHVKVVLAARPVEMMIRNRCLQGLHKAVSWHLAFGHQERSTVGGLVGVGVGVGALTGGEREGRFVGERLGNFVGGVTGLFVGAAVA
jgi:hypothetical protein